MGMKNQLSDDHYDKATSGGLAISECAPSRASPGNARNFPHTLNKTPYPESSEYTSRDNEHHIQEDNHHHHREEQDDVVGHGAFAIRNPSGNNNNNMTSMVDNLMEPQESAPGSNGSVKGLLVAAEVASVDRDTEIQEEAERLRQQIRRMQQQGQQEVVRAVASNDDDDEEKSAPGVPDEAAKARNMMGKIVAVCLFFGAIRLAWFSCFHPPPNH